MIDIRKGTVEDAKEKGYVHYTSWIETYTGLFDQEYFDRLSLERSIQIATEHPENTYVALEGGHVVGFACYMEARDEDVSNTGEISAVYILKSHQKQGIGKQLMDACYKELSNYNHIILWVLKTNTNAIAFYQKEGFIRDNIEKPFHGQTIIRMKKTINNSKII